MKLDVENENLCINKIVGHKKDSIIVEGDMIVPDIKPDIINTISTTGNACVYKKEVLDGKVRLDGNIDVYIIYSRKQVCSFLFFFVVLDVNNFILFAFSNFSFRYILIFIH